MEYSNISFYLLIYFVIVILFQNSHANICQNCLCTIAEDTTISINCHNRKFTTINILRFGLISAEYNGTLSILNLTGNNITYLPGDMFKSSRHLKVLNLSNNLLQEVRGSLLKKLNNLEILYLCNNNISEFEVSTLPSLRILNLSNNSLKDLDVEFHKALPLLTDLNLSNNYLDDSLNSTLSLLSQLKYLDISYNNFNLIDNENFNHLSQLLSLNLSHNAIRSLVNQNFPDSLIELNVGFNLLTVFPNNLCKIQILNIEFNQIQDIQNISNELEYLNISGNLLTKLPALRLHKLKILDLSCNKFVTLPQTLSTKNYPVLETLILSGNLLKYLQFPSLLRIKSLILRNLSYIEKIDANSFENLNHHDDCLNITLTDNRKLGYIDEKALKKLNLCFLDLKNNQFTSFSPQLFKFGFKAKFGVDLEGNPIHCNCSMQWMIDDFVPWLYSVNPDLLNNLRCSAPENLHGKRMVHWYKWKERVLCNDFQLFSSRIIAETLEVSSENKSVTLRLSNGMIFAFGIAMIMIIALVATGIVLARRAMIKQTRINRRF